MKHTQCRGKAQRFCTFQVQLKQRHDGVRGGVSYMLHTFLISAYDGGERHFSRTAFPVGKTFSTSTLSVTTLGYFGITTILSIMLMSDAGDPNLVSDLQTSLH